MFQLNYLNYEITVNVLVHLRKREYSREQKYIYLLHLMAENAKHYIYFWYIGSLYLSLILPIIKTRQKVHFPSIK